jgi:hypothetical protein
VSIAPDLDKLMWNIADSGETAAAESFQKRFPELKHELSKRMNLVQDIKKAKNLHSAVPARPEFKLKQRGESPSYKPSGRLVAVTSFVLGAAVVFAAAYTFFRSRNDVPAAISRPIPLGQSVKPCPTPAANASDSVKPEFTRNLPDENGVDPKSTHAGSQTQIQAQPQSNVQDRPDVQLTQTQNGVEPIKDSAKASAKGQRIIMKQVPLSTALRTISSQYGLKIDTAPGFPDPTVDIDSLDKDALAILKDIGSKYGFGVLEEGDKSVLLVPQSKS